MASMDGSASNSSTDIAFRPYVSAQALAASGRASAQARRVVCLKVFPFFR